ncbi:hypothetical protein LIA77_07622 [Sarocladium implicatum]|nr:hypothetical protein LIA77_07622 [Sarocladium implicatum]
MPSLGDQQSQSKLVGKSTYSAATDLVEAYHKGASVLCYTESWWMNLHQRGQDGSGLIMGLQGGWRSTGSDPARSVRTSGRLLGAWQRPVPVSRREHAIFAAWSVESLWNWIQRTRACAVHSKYPLPRSLTPKSAESTVVQCKYSEKPHPQSASVAEHLPVSTLPVEYAG